MALAAFVRAHHVLSADFPLNDGGLFLRMTQEIQAAHYHLPAFTSYNNEAIPFAYSPLAFYITGLINAITGISLLQLFRFIPLVATILTVVAFYHLARTMLRDQWAAAAAVLAFGLIPRSYIWLLMGGGLTRSIGLLFAIIALQQAYQLYTRREWRYAPTTAIACALTVATHLSTASFLAFSIALFFVFFGLNQFGLLSSVVVGVLTVLLSAIWWAPVVAQHGFAPFHAAQSVSGSIFGDVLLRYAVLLRLARFNTGIAGEPLFPLVSVLAAIGAIASFRPALLILPVWWVVITALDVRGGMTYAPIPAALLAGIAVVYVLIPGLHALYGGAQGLRLNLAAPDRQSRLTAHIAPLLRFVPVLILCFLLLYAVATSLTRNPDYGGEASVLTALTPADRDAMHWVAQHTPGSSLFLVVSGKTWSADRVAEWFPAIANRTSISTVQGSEWLPGFNGRVEVNDAFQKRCKSGDGRCLDAWAASLHRPFSYVYVPKTSAEPCCTPLIASLRQDPGYFPVYDGLGAFIAQRR